jgi:hypothetical protein
MKWKQESAKKNREVIEGKRKRIGKNPKAPAKQ